jgi:hypothetical protein
MTAQQMLPQKPTTGQLTSLLWAATAAILANLFLALPWWRPYCRNQDGGPGYNAIGLPLPFAEPTGVSSMEYFWMPHAYLLDTLLLTALGYLIIRHMPLPKPKANGKAVKVIATAGFISVFPVGGLQTPIWTIGWRPEASLTTESDRYLDFRPAFMVDPRTDGRCAH